MTWAIIRVRTLTSFAWYWRCTRVLSLITFHSEYTAVKQHIHGKLRLWFSLFKFWYFKFVHQRRWSFWRFNKLFNSKSCGLRIPSAHNALRTGCALLNKMAAAIRAWTRAQLICHLLVNELGDPLFLSSNINFWFVHEKYILKRKKAMGFITLGKRRENLRLWGVD